MATQATTESGDGDADGLGHPITVTLGYRAPHDHAALLAFLATRAIPGIETVDGPAVRRSVRAGALAGDAGTDPTGSTGWLEARFVPAASKVLLSFSPSLGPCSGVVIAAARRWLDLDASPATIDAALAGLPGEPGLRLPGSVDGFELAVRAVLGQQVTVAGARTLAGRLVERFGDPAATPWPDIHRSFPSPQTLSAAPVERIAELGIIRSRAGAIQALAGAWRDLQPLLDPGAAAEPLVERLRALPGIGDWTAHYIAMRALGWPDAFPHGDVAALKAMRHLFGTVSARAADMHAEAWAPWRCLCAAAPLAIARGACTGTRPSSRCPCRATVRPGTTATYHRSRSMSQPARSSARHVAQMRFSSPLGPVLLARTADGLAGAWFDAQKHHPEPIDAPFVDDDALLCRTADQLGAYFAGDAVDFDLPLDLQGTPFQQAVWQELLRLERGRTCSYGDIARRLGRPAAGRAVGAAVGRNPVSVIVPCHRVVGSTGALTGYAGGLDRKIELLRIESSLLA